MTIFTIKLGATMIMKYKNIITCVIPALMMTSAIIRIITIAKNIDYMVTSNVVCDDAIFVIIWNRFHRKLFQ